MIPAFFTIEEKYHRVSDAVRIREQIRYTRNCSVDRLVSVLHEAADNPKEMVWQHTDAIHGYYGYQHLDDMSVRTNIFLGCNMYKFLRDTMSGRERNG